MTHMAFCLLCAAGILLVRYREALLPLYLAAGIAILLDLPVTRLAQMLPFRRTGLRRACAVILVFILILLFLVLTTVGLLPQIESSAGILLQRLPEYLVTLKRLLNRVPLPNRNFPEELIHRVSSSLLSGAWQFTRGIGSTLAGSLSSAGTTIVLCLYFLCSKEGILRQFQGILSLLPEPTKQTCRRILRLAREVLWQYLGSRLLDSGILLLCCLPGLMLCRIPYAVLFSLLIAIGNLIPFLGSLCSTAFCCLLLLAIRPIQALWFLLFVLAVQQLDNNLIYPRIAGEKLGLPAVWSVTAVLIGARIGGAAGAFLGVPLMALCWRLTEEFLPPKRL